MVRIPFIKIPGVRVGSIDPTLDIGTGGATPAPPTPIIFLTQWKMMGNSEVHTDEYLTQWKVSGNSQIQQYLTQWKVEGNSVVSNPSANLPQGYKKCKYLEFHGTEYIFSGVNTNDTIGANISFSTNTASKELLGRRQSTTEDGFIVGMYSSNNIYVAYGGATINTNINMSVYDGNKHTIILDSEKFSVDGTLTTFSRGTFNNYYQIQIGGWDTSAASLARLFVGKIYNVKLYDSNGNLFNGIPCLDDNNVPCLYDTVSNTAFYNDGTGTFGYELEQPTILSCGDLGQDGKYHVKISNGVDVFDIVLDEPLRKVNDVADNIEFVNGVVTVTRKCGYVDLGTLDWVGYSNNRFRAYFELPLRPNPYDVCQILNAGGYTSVAASSISVSATQDKLIACVTLFITAEGSGLVIRDEGFSDAQDAKQKLSGIYAVYELATPTTEVIQAPQISVSSTNTYSSANTTPYSAFTYANPLIYSCGDYSDVDGKYHVKISNGVTIYDIALDEPLRKVNNVADSIEFADGVATLTRNFASALLSDSFWDKQKASNGKYRYSTHGFERLDKPIKPAASNGTTANILCSIYNTVTATNAYSTNQTGVSVELTIGQIYLYDENYNQEGDFDAFKAHIQGVELIYEVATPTTETIQVSPFPVSPTDTYTSANDTPYSAFEYKKNVEIWSCGEYNPTDGKYHILVQPLGGSIADIALDEPLRKVNNVADKIEFADGVGTVTRNISMDDMGDLTYTPRSDQKDGFFIISLPNRKYYQASGVLCTIYTQVSSVGTIASATQNLHDKECCYFFVANNYNYVDRLFAYDTDYIGATGAQIKDGLSGQKIIYELATPITEPIEVSQIQEAESYSCVISQGGKAVSWSVFITNNE